MKHVLILMYVLFFTVQIKKLINCHSCGAYTMLEAIFWYYQGLENVVKVSNLLSKLDET